MQLKEHEPLGPKTTMRIGGTARYFAELNTKDDVEEATKFAADENIPLIVLGSGSNTVFADGEINGLVVRIAAQEVRVESDAQPPIPNAARVTAEVGKNLAMLINELATQGLDLSALTGIPGTIGGAIFGNAGQGPKGIWINSFVESVTAYSDGAWKALTKKDCHFRYRESAFKDQSTHHTSHITPIIWSVILNVPNGIPEQIKETIEALLKKRIESQPHQSTAGSCFKAVGETPAWQLIDAAGLRGFKSGGVQISEKHANFLISEKGASFHDALSVVRTVKEKIPHRLEVEMRFIGKDGTLAT